VITSEDPSSVRLRAGIQRGSAEAGVVHIGSVRDKICLENICTGRSFMDVICYDI